MFGEFHWFVHREERHVVVESLSIEAPVSHDSPYAFLDMTDLRVRLDVVVADAHRQSRHVPGIHVGDAVCRR